MFPQALLLWVLHAPAFLIVIKVGIWLAQRVNEKAELRKISIASLVFWAMGFVTNFGIVEQWYSTPYREALRLEDERQKTAETEYYGRQCNTLPAMDENMVKLCNDWRGVLNSTAKERAYSRVLNNYSQSMGGLAQYISNDWLLRISLALMTVWVLSVLVKRIRAHIYYKDYRKCVSTAARITTGSLPSSPMLPRQKEVD